MNAVSCIRDNLSVEDIVQLRKCHKTLIFNELSLKYNGFEKTRVIRKALGVIKNMKVITRETAFKMVEEVFNNEYLREWFDFQYQYEQALERDLMRIKRILEYICDKGYSILDVDVPYSFQVEATYKGYYIKNITGKVDFVFESANEVILATIRYEENPYSHRARKASNLEGNSMEVLATAIGLGQRYVGKKVYAQDWYLKNKDDTSYSLIPVFEHKKGKNIVSISVDDLKTLRERFYTAASYLDNDLDKCDSCLHNRVCKSYEIKEDMPVTKEKAISKGETTPKFTSYQRAVVEHMEGPMCVIAGPGSGKTFVLVHRLSNMLKKGISPDNILFVTFTNKAAEEIKERVMALLGTEDESTIPNIYTFNALGYTILKENPMLLGKRVKLADNVDRYMLIGDAIARSPKIKNVSYDSISTERGLIRMLDKWFAQISKGKEEFIKANSDKDIEGIMRVYDLYAQLFKEKGYIDYDMQISLVNTLFKKYPSLVNYYVRKFKYIMVDEFQDSSEDQAHMIYAIAKKHGNIVVVGDDDQSIYEWRGGSNKFMLNFGQDFPNAKIIIMNDNFRSVNTILVSANNVISNNGNRYEKVIRGHKEATYQPIYLRNRSADSIPSLITEILKKGYKLGDVAILARDNKRIREVMGALDGHYKVSAPKVLLYEDTVFQSLYDILTLYYKGMDDDEALYRILRVLGVNEISKISKTETLYQNLVKSNRLLPIDKMDIDCLASYEKYKDISSIMAAGYKIISCFKKIQYGKGVSTFNDLLYVLLGITGHKVVKTLLETAEERAFVTVSELYNYMQNIRLYCDDKSIEYEPGPDAINLLTCHGSKGKEFPVVIVYGTEDFKSVEEEIRLFYVSITRAKNTLFFIETVCNKCELFPKLQGSVYVK